MKSLGAVWLCVAVCAVQAVHAQIPIPRREVGFVYNGGIANASVHLDFYIDLICPDSQQALPTMYKVAQLYGPQLLRLTTHLFPLPYHRNGFYAAKGSHVMQQLAGVSEVYDWINIIYSNINSLTNTATHNLSDACIVRMLGKMACQVVPSESCEKFEELVDSPTIEMDTRVAWKYACTRGVAGTPTFMVNDVVVAAEITWTVEDWRKIIDPLLTPSHSAQ